MSEKLAKMLLLISKIIVNFIRICKIEFKQWIIIVFSKVKIRVIHTK